jgi:hypothetical protein
VEETQRQNLVTSFTNVLRTSALVGVVDVQRAAMAFSALVERNPEGENLNLGPLYDFLLEQKAPELAVGEVLVFLKSREERFGLRMDLPPKLAALSEEERNKLVLAFTSRGASSGTQAGAPTKTDSGKANKKPSSPGTDGNVNELAVAAAAAAAQPPKAKKEEFGSKAAPANNTKRLVVVAVILGVLLAINLAFNVATAPPPPAPLVFNDPAGLPCLEAEGAKSTAICRVSKAFADKTPRAVIDAKGGVTAAAARGLGYQKLLVFSIEDKSLRWVF